MPLLHRETFNHLDYCLWNTEDNELTPSDIHSGFFHGERFRVISHPEARAQYLGARMALQTLVGACGTLDFLSNGKPVYKPRGTVSLSHTIGCAAACYHPDRACGIDIERQHRVFSDRVVMRFTHPEEMPLIEHFGAVHLWCAKEAVYKANGTSGVQFSEHIRVDWHAYANNVLMGTAYTHNKKKWILENRLINGMVISTAIFNKTKTD